MGLIPAGYIKLNHFFIKKLTKRTKDALKVNEEHDLLNEVIFKALVQRNELSRTVIIKAILQTACPIAVTLRVTLD